MGIIMDVNILPPKANLKYCKTVAGLKQLVFPYFLNHNLPSKDTYRRISESKPYATLFLADKTVSLFADPY
jgi:hypothetical protein